MKWDAMIYYERRDAKNEGKIESILELLEEIGEIPENLKDKILKETDLAIIKSWLKLAAKVDSIAEFQEKM